MQKADGWTYVVDNEQGKLVQLTTARSDLVFISHASQDRDVAERVCQAVEGRGHRCWIALRDIQPGQPYAAAIIGAINAASTLVLILSKSATESAHVSREVERAASKNRRIITLRTDGAPLSLAFEYFLSECQWLDAHTNGLEDALVSLIKAVAGADAVGHSPRVAPTGGHATDREFDGDDCILMALWGCMDPNLQDALSLAYNKKRREGSRRISTKDFFQALQCVGDDTLDELFGRLPRASLPEKSDIDVNMSRVILEETPLLSDCISESLHRFGALGAVARKLSPVDVFIDVARNGHGSSVARLRRHGVGPDQIAAAVNDLKLSVIEPCILSA